MRFNEGVFGVVFAAMCLLGNQMVFAHCEIPCGIYNDSLRIALIEEHIGTVEKSMNSIVNLSKEKETDYNQLVRWIDNKEAHARNIQEIVWQYFMNQRIKPVKADQGKAYRKYVKEITLLHEMLIFAMKSKQTTDIANVEKLKKLIAEFKKSYFSMK